MRVSRGLLTGVALAVLAAAGPAVSQTPMDDPLDARDAKRLDRMEKVVRELRAIVFQLRDTGKPVTVQPADTDARIDELGGKLNDLGDTLRKLNGSLETATHDLDQERRENAALKAQLQSLGQRLDAAEQKLAAAPAAGPGGTAADGGAPGPAAAAAGDPAKDFAKARQLMLAGDYDGAEQAFSGFVQAYPDSPKVQEASYWWGKTLSVRADHADAAKAYIGAIRGWPQTSWAPDAVVELARSLAALKKPTDACQTLAELGRRYPKAAASVAARAAAVRAQAKCAA
jgi:tol-pal system protein YbgF